MTYTFRPFHILCMPLIVGVLYCIFMAFSGHYFCDFRHLDCGTDHILLMIFQLIFSLVFIFFTLPFIADSSYKKEIYIPLPKKSKPQDINDEKILKLTSQLINNNDPTKEKLILKELEALHNNK